VLRTVLLAITLLALTAPAALASNHDGGEGLWGETNDKVVTYAGFILIVAFPVLALVLTLIQQRLDKRKDRRLAAAKARRARADLRGGW
jgi:preprotein translocase subunit SecG